MRDGIKNGKLMDNKEMVGEIIKQKGYCEFTNCKICPLDMYKGACLDNDNCLRIAITYFMEHYSKEDLVEVLI